MNGRRTRDIKSPDTLSLQLPAVHGAVFTGTSSGRHQQPLPFFRWPGAVELIDAIFLISVFVATSKLRALIPPPALDAATQGILEPSDDTMTEKQLHWPR
jgi:hypothetical protein